MEQHSVRRNGHSPSQGALQRALDVLEVLVDDGPETSLAGIASRSGLAKSTVHRILQTYVSRGYVLPAGGGGYAPGSKILSLAGQILTSLDYARHARPALTALQAQIPETIHFGALSGQELVYVEKLEGRRAYHMASIVGMRLAFHSTAIGKVVLANLPPAEREALLVMNGLHSRTPNTITDREVLEHELARVRAQGYAFDNEENEVGIRCIGAPTFSNAGRIAGGVSVSAPAFQFSPDQARRVALYVIEAASAVSASLGAPRSLLAGPRNALSTL